MFKKIRNKVNTAISTVRATVACKKAEGYVDSGVKILIAVVIVGHRTDDGGAVRITADGQFTMNGGSIVGCYASGKGGAVYVVKSTFTLENGVIKSCKAGDRGGAVYVAGRSGDGIFTMNGGSIADCTDTNGRALYLIGGKMNAGGGTVGGTVVLDVNSDGKKGVIQGSGSNATNFGGDVTNYGEIKHGTFSGTVTLGDSDKVGKITDGVFTGPVTTASEGEAAIGGGVFNNTVTINRGRITNGTFNKDVAVGSVAGAAPLTLIGGTYNSLIINESTYAAFAGVHSPLGIVREKPNGANGRTYHKVTFDTAGGKMDYPVRYFLHNGNISSLVEPAFRPGYFFAGWYNGENKWNYSDTVCEDDLTLTAHWTACDHSGHTGEKPDCTTSVICTECGGTIAALSHDFSKQEHNGDEHWKKCSRCDVTDDKEPHVWDNGVTTIPSTCVNGGKKTYTCNKCGMTKIEAIDAKGHNYGAEWQQDATHHWHKCRNCNEKINPGQHTDSDKNHTCDICSKVYSDHTDTNKDHKCDYCGKNTSGHEDTDKNHICDYCGKVITDHAGGKATCKSKAECDVCTKAYGKLDTDNHTDLKHINAKAATKETEGNTEYWHCGGCNKYYADAEATKEITKADTVMAKLPNEAKSPRTGENSGVLLWIALLFVGGTLIGTAVKCKRKKHSVK